MSPSQIHTEKIEAMQLPGIYLLVLCKKTNLFCSSALTAVFCSTLSCWCHLLHPHFVKALAPGLYSPEYVILCCNNNTKVLLTYDDNCLFL